MFPYRRRPHSILQNNKILHSLSLPDDLHVGHHAAARAEVQGAERRWDSVGVTVAHLKWAAREHPEGKRVSHQPEETNTNRMTHRRLSIKVEDKNKKVEKRKTPATVHCTSHDKRITTKRNFNSSVGQY